MPKLQLTVTERRDYSLKVYLSRFGLPYNRTWALFVIVVLTYGPSYMILFSHRYLNLLTFSKTLIG